MGVGIFLLLVLVPLAAVFVRDLPGKDDPEQAPLRPSDLTMWAALRSPAFWIFAMSSSAFGLVYSGISLFNESILAQRGFDASVYHTVLVVSTMLGLLANFGGGWLATRWTIQRVAGLGMAVLAAALVALPLVKTYAEVMLYGIAMGIAGGVVTVVFFSVWGQMFGRTHLGRIQGCAQMMTVFASAVGPLLLAETLQQTGSYDLMFNGLAVVVLFLGIASWYCPMPAAQVLSAAQA
jgi:predicted MFS family arabinose efflux permease